MIMYRMAKFTSAESPSTLAPQAKEARASGENLNYVTLAQQKGQKEDNYSQGFL